MRWKRKTLYTNGQDNTNKLYISIAELHYVHVSRQETEHTPSPKADKNLIQDFCQHMHTPTWISARSPEQTMAQRKVKNDMLYMMQIHVNFNTPQTHIRFTHRGKTTHHFTPSLSSLPLFSPQIHGIWPSVGQIKNVLISHANEAEFIFHNRWPHR